MTARPTTTTTLSKKLDLTIYDSADSDMSATALTESRESTLEAGTLSHLPKQADDASKPDDPQALPSDVTLDKLISTFFLKLPERHRFLPQVFDKQGRLWKQFQHLKPILDAARAEQKREAAAVKQLSSSRLKDTISSSPPVSRTKEEAVVHATSEGLPTPSQLEDCDNSSTARPRSHPKGSLANSRGKHPVNGATDGYPVQNSRLLPPVGIFSISSMKNIPTFKTYGGHSQITKPHAKPVQSRADHDQSRRALRSGPQETVSERGQVVLYSPTPKIISKKSYNEKALPIAQGETPSSNTSSSTLLGELERSQEMDTVVVDVEEQRQTGATPKASETGAAASLPSARVKVPAPHSVQDKIQQPRAQHSNVCRTCGKKSCSCGLTQQPEGILCSDNDCFKSWWGVEDLRKNCGIKLRDAQEISRKLNCWYCPPCASKQRAANTSPTKPGSAHISGATPIVSKEPLHPISDNGSWPEDADIREPLQALTGILQQYTGASTMARNQLSQINPQMPILNIPCVRDESLQSVGIAPNAIYILRQLLDVPDGVLVKEKVAQAKLQDTTCSVWIRGILSFLVNEFVFHSGSPFEDVALWRKILANSGHTRDQAENLIHEHRILIMKTFEASPDNPDIPPEFRDRVSRRHQAFVEHLNFTMLPLVGGDSDAQTRHRKIASIASELNIKVFAYRGTFEEIRPRIKELFDAQRHAEENPEPNMPDLEGQPLLVTTMMGVRYKHPEKDWRTCSPAKVKMWPLKETGRIHTALDLLPDMACGNALMQETRIVPKKRRIEAIL